MKDIILVAILILAILVITVILLTERKQRFRLLKRLEETEGSLGVAIETADMFFFDYYPERKVAVALSKLDNLSFGKVISDYPKAWFENQVIHPDDLERATEVFKEVEAGRKSAELEYRILSGDKYHWYVYHMQSVYGEKAERIKVVVSRTDITLRKEVELEYQRHLNAMFFNHRDTLLSCRMDLTKNRVMELYTIQDSLKDKLFVSSTINHSLEIMADYISPIFRKRALEKFSRESLIEQFNEGKHTVRYSFSYLHHSDVRWAECAVEMAKEPGSGDIDAILYVTDISYRRVIELVIDSAANHDYDFLT